MSTFAGSEALPPKWFVTRENGDMVPLIAIDELPSNLEIRGLNRTLSPQDLTGMTGLGVHASRHRKHHVTMIDTGLSRGIGIALAEARAASPEATGFSGSNISDEVNDLINEYRDRAPQVNDSEEQQPANLIDPPGLLPWRSSAPVLAGRNRGVKEYCSYWIRKGECDYMQQGCIYKHEMPHDLPTLNRIGLQDLPQWYRELHGYPSYLSKQLKDIAFLRELCRLPASDRPFRRNWRQDGIAGNARSTRLVRLPHEERGTMFNSSSIEAARASSNPAARRTHQPSAGRTESTRGRFGATKRIPQHDGDHEQGKNVIQIQKVTAAINKQETDKANIDVLTRLYPDMTLGHSAAVVAMSPDDQPTSSRSSGSSQSSVYVNASSPTPNTELSENDDIDPLLRGEFDNEADYVVSGLQELDLARAPDTGNKHMKTAKPAARNPSAELARNDTRRPATPRGAQRVDARPRK